MSQPLVSIIVPIYKVEPYLRRCLDSIVNQTYTNLEIILVDDGSPDGCPQICDEYAAKDNRIVVIHKENGGLSDARNAGLDICKGEYISFVDSDDWVDEKYIEILLDLAIKENADIAVGKHEKTTNNIASQTVLQSEYSSLNSIQAIENLFGKNSLTFTVSWGKIYKRNLWKSLRFPKGKLYEDAYLSHILYDLSKKICFSNNVIYYYFQRPNSIMGMTKDPIHALEPQILLYKYLMKRHPQQTHLMYPKICWDCLWAYKNTSDPQKIFYARYFFNKYPNKPHSILTLILYVSLKFPLFFIILKNITSTFSKIHE